MTVAQCRSRMPSVARTVGAPPHRSPTEESRRLIGQPTSRRQLRGGRPLRSRRRRIDAVVALIHVRQPSQRPRLLLHSLLSAGPRSSRCPGPPHQIFQRLAMSSGHVSPWRPFVERGSVLFWLSLRVTLEERLLTIPISTLGSIPTPSMRRNKTTMYLRCRSHPGWGMTSSCAALGPREVQGGWYNPSTKEWVHPHPESAHDSHYDVGQRGVPGYRRQYLDGRPDEVVPN
jgi:hypothetical protein